jgi:hypothetical protein
MSPTCILVIELTERFLTPSDNAVSAKQPKTATFPPSHVHDQQGIERVLDRHA